jgi:hypothetical protein
MTHSIAHYQSVDECLEKDPHLFKQLYPRLDSILESCKGDSEKAEPLVLDLYLELVIPDTSDEKVLALARERITKMVDDAAARRNVSRLERLTSMVMSVYDDKRRLG